MKNIFLISLLLISNLLASNSVSVQVRHKVYPFLERLEALGIINRFIDGAKPMSRGKISDFLKKAKENREQLTSIDKNKLDNYLLEFRYEIDRNVKYKPMHNDQNMYSPLQSWTDFKKDFFRYFKRNQPEEPGYAFLWENEENSFHFNVSQNFTFDQHSDDMYRSANWQEYKFRGTIGENFGYAAMVQLQAVRGDKEYRLGDPLLKGAWSEESDTKDKIYGDRAGGEIAWASKYVGVGFTQQELEWGYGKSGKLILSNFTEHYPYLTIKADWGWGRFTAVQGKLLSHESYRADNGYPVYADKWLAAHRLEIAPFRWWRFSINENFIYGNRYADWAYLVPMNFYRAVQHKLRDRDNGTISLDTKFIPYKGASLYATVFLDEFKASAIGTDWYGNKHAMLIGFNQMDPFGLPNLSLTVEYTAIRPWVYTHKYLINSYTSDNHSLGHWAGPNSEVIYADVEKEWSRRLITGASFRQYKHGDNYPNLNIGGDILLGHYDLLGEQTEPVEESTFLDGILTTTKNYDFYARYEVFNGMFIEGLYRFTTIKSEGLEKDHYEMHFGFKFRY